MAEGPPYKPGFWLAFKRTLFGRGWAARRIESLDLLIQSFDLLCLQDHMPDNIKNDFWEASSRMQRECDWLRSTLR